MKVDIDINEIKACRREHRSVDVLTSTIDMLRKMKAENTRLKRENLMFRIANAELNDRLTIKKGLQDDQ